MQDLTAVSSSDFSMIGLFWQADLIVKSVMILLLLSSIWSWAIIFEKIRLFKQLKTKTKLFEDHFWAGGSLEALYDKVKNKPREPMSAIFAAAMKELHRSSVFSSPSTALKDTSLRQRVERIMQVNMEREIASIESRITFLATTGSVSPFIGLFGTVWGIMNSFTSIGASGNTSLAVVAPGIAEALFATALGLLAAIPAVIAYNKFSSDINKYAGRLENFVGEFGAIISRQLEQLETQPK